jgi:hypothetical protein
VEQKQISWVAMRIPTEISDAFFQKSP